MARPTLKDIAAACGVSTATVSMALSGKGSISAEMTKKIVGTVEKLGYQPKASRKKKEKDFKNVFIIQWNEAPFLWHFSLPFVLTLEKILIEEGYKPIVIHKLPELDNETLYNEIIAGEAGAVFAIHYVNTELYDRFEAENIPVILINNSNYQDKFWSVLTDDIQGAYEATETLINLGHERIAYAEYKRTFQQVVIDRYNGFKLALDRKGIRFDDKHMISVDLEDRKSLEEQLTAVLESEDAPTGIFIHDDYFAATIHKLLTEMGYRIPEDISIICPGDVLEYTEPFFPRISTLQIDRQLMTRMAWDFLLSRINHQSEDVKVLKTKMIYVDRGSCAEPTDRRNHE